MGRYPKYLKTRNIRTLSSFLFHPDLPLKPKWTVKAHGIQVVKLFYLSRNEFLFLKGLRDRLVGRLQGEGKCPGEAKTPIHSKISLFKSPIRDVLDPSRVNPASHYEPTWMFETRDSILWSWKRTIEYFNQMTQAHGLATN